MLFEVEFERTEERVVLDMFAFFPGDICKFVDVFTVSDSFVVCNKVELEYVFGFVDFSMISVICTTTAWTR